MKKLFLGLAVASVSIFSLAGCQKSTTTEDTRTLIKMQFVPSNAVSLTTQQIDVMKGYFETLMPNHRFEITMGSSYLAVMNAMIAGQVDAGFLPGQTFAQAEVTEPGKVEVILTAERSAYQVQVDFPNNPAAQIAAMNGADGYNYLGQQSYTQRVTYYNSIAIVKNDSPLVDITDLAQKNVAVQGPTSGAGRVYPAVRLNDFTGTNELPLKFATANYTTTGTNLAANEVGWTQAANYASAVAGVLDGTYDAAWIFLDVRYANFYSVAPSNAFYDPQIFSKTRVLTNSMTAGIYNDTVSVASAMPTVTRALLQNAFQSFINTTAGKQIMSIYSHLGYRPATNADYASEIAVYNTKKTLGY